MPGQVVKVLVAEGEAVTRGQTLVVLEAMKMETEIQAPVAGTVESIYVKKGEAITPNEVLMTIR